MLSHVPPLPYINVFLFLLPPPITMPVSVTTAAAPLLLLPVTQYIAAALDQQHITIHQNFRNFFAGNIIHSLHRRPGNAHLIGALFLGTAFHIDQPNRLIFIYRHNHIAPRSAA
jgi:hypothetical protein